jgi:hypothetical protein
MPACLACGYIRQKADTSPDCECPKCGRIYSKVQSVLDKESARKKQWIRSSEKDSDLDPIGSFRKANKTGLRTSNEVSASFVIVTLLTMFGALYLWTSYESAQAQQRAIQAQQQAAKAQQEEARRLQRAAREAEQQRQRDTATQSARPPRQTNVGASQSMQGTTGNSRARSRTEIERELRELLAQGERLDRTSGASCMHTMSLLQPKTRELRSEIGQMPMSAERVWLGSAATAMTLCVSCEKTLGPQNCVIARRELSELR